MMAIDASELLGAPQIAGVKVMPRGAMMARAVNQGGMSVGGVIGAAGGALGSGKAAKAGVADRAETPEFKGQALLTLTDVDVALVKLKQGALSAKPTEVIARAPREQVTGVTLASGLVPKLSISFADGSAWSMDVPRVIKKQGDTNRIVELLGR
jgi:F0F1-type ATP synthase membrane subunit c/vacuolar-type H+-ATPase subunit K